MQSERNGRKGQKGQCSRSGGVFCIFAYNICQVQGTGILIMRYEVFACIKRIITAYAPTDCQKQMQMEIEIEIESNKCTFAEQSFSELGAASLGLAVGEQARESPKYPMYCALSLLLPPTCACAMRGYNVRSAPRREATRRNAHRPRPWPKNILVALCFCVFLGDARENKSRYYIRTFCALFVIRPIPANIKSCSPYSLRFR